MNRKRENDIFKSWKDFPSIFIPKENVSANCRADVDKLFAGAEKFQLWALKMLDASAKLPSGILNGNINQYGDFDQCLSIKNPVRGKYCLASMDLVLEKQYFINVIDDEKLKELDSLIHAHRFVSGNRFDIGHRVPRASTILWGVCLPESCSAKELENEMDKSLRPYHLYTLVNENYCTVLETKSDYSFGKIFTVIFFIMILLLNIFGTFMKKDSEKNLLMNLVSQFSFHANINKFMNTSSENNIIGLDAIRTLNSIGLYASHKSFALFYNPFFNKTYMTEKISVPWTVLGRTAIIYTDSFMLISGFLSAKSSIEDMKKYGSIKFFKKLINRLFRIIPVLLTVILFATYILPNIANGPQTHVTLNEHAEICKSNMWKSFLFIHNLMGFENICLTHTHQLGIDMQLFFMTPLAVIILWYFKDKGIYLLLSIATYSTFLRFRVTMEKELSTIVYAGMPISRFFDTANYSYTIPTHRATIYIMGILLAYIMIIKKNIQLTTFQASLGWIIATCLGLTTIISPWRMVLLGYEYSKVDTAYYGAFEPILWGIFIFWMIWASNNDCAGGFKHFLEWKGFKIFNKIIYGVYLTQFPIFFYYIAVRKHPDYFSTFSMIDISEFVVVIIASLVVTLMVEIPFNNISKILLKQY